MSFAVVKGELCSCGYNFVKCEGGKWVKNDKF